MGSILVPKWGQACNSTAVSYTHLDVYKRQAVGGAIVDSGNFDWMANAEKFPGLCTPDDSYHGITYAEKFGKEGAFITKCTACLLYTSLQLGFLYSIMVLGIYISFRILNIPDLTTEGSFTFGLAASSILTAAGHPLLGLVGALIAGALAGSVTGFLQTKLDIHPVLAGILRCV